MKSKLLLSALMLAGATFASQAQWGVPDPEPGAPDAQIYWSFNSGPVEMTPDPNAEGNYRGVYSVPASEKVSFYMDLYGQYNLVPGVYSDDNITVYPDGKQVVFEDGRFTGTVGAVDINNTITRTQWYIDNWAGGKIEVVLDTDNFEVTLVVADEEDVPGVPGVSGDLYIAGNFNDYAPEGLEIWQLTETPEEGTYRAVFNNLPAGQLSFHFDFNGISIVPEENVTVLADDDFYSGSFTTTGVANTNWRISNWVEGNGLEVTVDFNNEEVILSLVEDEENVPGTPAEYSLILSGNFNNYATTDPSGVWAIVPTDAEDVYRSTFNIAASDQIDFYISRLGGNMVLVPGVVADGDVEPSEDSVTIELEDGFYSGSFAQTSLSNAKWVIENWAGGDLEVTVDYTEMTIILSVGEDVPEIGADLFIAGNFNEYAPEGLDIWALTAKEAEGVYTGTFNIEPTTLVDFYIDYNSMALVPAVVNEDEDVEPAAENVTVVWDEDFFSGALTSTGVAKAKWVIENWEGGQLEVTVDLLNNEIILSKAVEDTPPVMENNVFIAGNFNDYAPEGLEIWALGAQEEEEGVYRGTFNNIAAGEVSFHIDYYGMALVPGVEVDGDVEAAESDVEVVLEDGFYSGPLASTGVANTNWVISEWDGSTLEVTVDINNGEILLSKVMDDEPEIGDVLFIAGNFNDYAPEGLEIWSLGKEEEVDGVYRGTFVEIPEGEVSFYLDYRGISLVPGVEVDDDVEPAASDVNVVWDEDYYTGAFATTGVANTNWVISNWDGMALEVTVDFNEGTIKLSKVTEITPEAGNLYIAGNFNDYAPEGLEIWSLGVDATGEVFEGEFVLPEGELSFYFLYETIAIVPGVEEDGDVVAATENVEIFDGTTSYSGMTAYTGLANVCWSDANWEGGVLYVTVDINNNKVSFSKEGTTGIESIGEVELNDGAIYNLQGVRVDANKLTKGIYIINGKKVLVK